ncbi:MAG TPA: NCS2 family permease, partial [Myxococcota bacterium]|nr:NCS2 family permease [Myxococcota bacterium]
SGIEIGRMDEFLPAFLVVVLMAFTYNIGIGMTAGFVAWPIMKIAAGKWRQVMPGMWVLAAISMAFFVFHL